MITSLGLGIISSTFRNSMSQQTLFASAWPRLARLLLIAVFLPFLLASSTSATLGPIAAYSCNEGTGVVLVDSSGNGKNGTITGGATWVAAGRFGAALSLDGVDDWVQVPAPLSFPSSEVTVSWWVNVPTQDFNNWADWWALQTASGGEYVAEIDGNGNPALYPIGAVPGASTADTAGHDLRGTGWHHLAAVMSTTAGAVRLYLDGALVGSGAWAAGGSTTGCMIGTRLNDGGGSRNIHSTIDEVRLYARALSAAEILAQYNAGQGTYGQPGESGLVAGWHLDEGGSTTAADYSGHGHSATLRNGPVWVAGKDF